MKINFLSTRIDLGQETIAGNHKFTCAYCCRECGTPVDVADLYCRRCGRKLDRPRIRETVTLNDLVRLANIAVGITS